MQQLPYRTDMETNANNEVHVGQLWSKYFAYWPIFLLLIFLALGGSWLYLRYTVSLYESTARLLIKDEKKGTEDNKAMESLDPLNVKKIIENETEVIQSRTLISDVVKSLSLYAPVFEEGRIRSKSAYVSSPVKIEVNNLNALREVKKVNFIFDKPTGKVIIDGTTYALNAWVATPYGHLRFVPNPHFDGSGNGKLYFSLVQPKNITLNIQKSLTVTSASKLSTILNLTIKDEVPERGEDILNELLKTYSKAIIFDKNTLAKNTLSFVEDRLSRVAHDLDSIEGKLQNFRANRGVFDIGTQGRLFLENVSFNDQKLSEISTQLAVLDQVEEYVRIKGDNQGTVPSTVGLSDPILPQLLTKLYESELEYERLRKTEGEGSIPFMALNSQIQRIKPSILESIQNQRKSLEAGRKNLSATNNSYSSALQTIPQKERELININREQSIKNDIYTFLLKKKEETALSYASTVADSRVVDQAESSVNPVSPKHKMIYLASIIAALLIGIGLITANESLNQKVLFRQEIESLSANPVIGEIAYERSSNPIVIGEGNKTFIAEQFRKLRLALNFIKISPNKKKIMVTSTISGEGKSFVAVNLALTLALGGKKVVLIELDLNKPSLRSRLNINDNTVGVTSYLQGESEAADIIQKTEVNENLFFIPAGQLPTNPSELLMNGKVQELFSYLDSKYDYIVIDTAPVGPVTDAYILSPYCDITLYVIRHNYTPKVFVQRIDANNKISQLNNVAIVFNGVHPKGFGKYNYGYGYGYGYVHNEKSYSQQS
ncbi:MAG: polysaccharide biosynthesis tyrosine autokinase [Chitinophagaceae bacterium]